MRAEVLDSSLGLTGPALVGAVSAALTLLPLIVLARGGTARPARIVARRTEPTGHRTRETPTVNSH